MSFRVYNPPTGEALSDLFECAIEGQKIPLHEARVSAYPFNRRWPGHQRSLDQTELVAFAAFEMDAPVTMTIKPNREFHDVIVRPLSKKVAPVIRDGVITLTIPSAGGYTVELDGYHQALHIFADPVKKYDVNPDDPNVIYFGPGIHDVGMIKPRDNQTVYIDEGAVVYACIHANKAKNIKVLGRGILDNSRNKELITYEVKSLGVGDFDVGNSVRLFTIQFTDCIGVTVDGITLRDSLCYNLSPLSCDDVVIDNVKIIGCWRYNSDGINLQNTRRAVVRNCFIRTYDDSLCIKGDSKFYYAPICEDILVENNVIWCDWGKALEFGAETFADEMRNITFRNNDLIRCSSVAMDIMNVDCAEIYNVLFEDIRVEYDPVSQPLKIQKTDEEVYVEDPNSTYMPMLFLAHTEWHYEYSQGRADRRGWIHDVTYRNITVTAPRVPRSAFRGYDAEHPTRGMHIENLVINGKRITTLEEANVEIGEFTEDITIK